ncbi:hypothetical protein ACLBW8_14715 [Pseudomonas sp. M5A4_2d]|uniref:hypothetical protein n=1 Tax=Pseudomonas sp. UBT TaxID=3239198 RepID=UPI003D800780
MKAAMDAKELVQVQENALTVDATTLPSGEEMELFQHATTMMIDRGDDDWMVNSQLQAA